VIGINSQIATNGGGNEGVAFAVPIATAEDVAQQLIDGGEVRRGYLGITGGDITPEAAEALDLPVERGAIVEQAYDGGPAADAGLQGADGEATVQGQTIPVGGDIITAVGGEQIEGMEDVISAVNAASPGDELVLTILRDGDEQELTVTLGNRPAQVEDVAAPSVP
jgi:S1-C subfamily serine protease